MLRTLGLTNLNAIVFYYVGNRNRVAPTPKLLHLSMIYTLVSLDCIDMANSGLNLLQFSSFLIADRLDRSRRRQMI